MIWKILGWLPHLLLVGAAYLFVLSALGLDWWPDTPSQLRGGLAISWFYQWHYMRETYKARAKVNDLRDALDRARRGVR